VADDDWLAHQFETHRARLRAVAFRMLGSQAEAEDAVQESWLRLSRADTTEIANLGGWLTTVVARVCLDMLRSRTSRREDPLDAPAASSVLEQEGSIDPEREVLLADSVGLALLVVLDTLRPAERLAFVLHDMFAVPFDEIAPIVGRSPDATKMLASRARRRVAEAAGDSPPLDAGAARRREVVQAFLAASREGDFEALVTLLDPDVVLRSDAAATAMGSPESIGGRTEVAGFFSGRARSARPVLVDGEPGLMWAHAGEVKMVFQFHFVEGTVNEVTLVADPARIAAMNLEPL
jgi:RNA polymerase sigma-70 factor (ECF subfamily)